MTTEPRYAADGQPLGDFSSYVIRDKDAVVFTPRAERATNALCELRVGRGLGATIINVCDYATIGAGRNTHIIHRDTLRALCGAGTAAIATVTADVDARAIRVGSRPVCARCRALLGEIPAPRLERSVA